MKPFVLLLLCISTFINSRAQQCLWAEQSETAFSASGQAIATDPSGNVYEAGIYSGARIVFGTDTLVNPDSVNLSLFLVKYDNLGNVLWARGYGGNRTSEATAVTTDGAGNVYLYGNYTDSFLSFGSFTLTNDTTRHNLFLTKINSSGTVVWAKNIPIFVTDTSQTLWASGMAASSDGHIAITGTFDSSITFGGIHLADDNTTGNEMFLAWYDTAGNAIWATHSTDMQPGANLDGGTAITVDPSNNIYVCGWTQGDSISFGSGVHANMPAPGSQSYFLVQYNTSGTPQWATGAGGSSVTYAYPAAITCDAGGVYVGGNFSSATITIGTSTLTNPSTSASAYPLNFVAKYSAAGAPLWAEQSSGNTLGNYIGGIAVGPWGLFVTGESSALPFSFAGHNFTQAGVFCIQLNPNTGDSVFLCWNARNGNGGKGYSNAIATYSPGVLRSDVVIAGSFQQVLSFIVPGPADTATLTTPSGVYNDAFLAQFSVPTEGVPVVKAPLNDVTLYPNPASGYLIINSSSTPVISYTVTDCRGALLLTGNPAQQQAQLNTTSLASGLYFVTIQTTDGVAVRKFVKM